MDYARYGRQIALAELGVAGQQAISSQSVRFEGPPEAVRYAELCWKNAGGVIATSPDRAVVVHIHSAEPILSKSDVSALAMVLGAAAACEAASKLSAAVHHSDSDDGPSLTDRMLDVLRSEGPTRQ